MRVQHPSISTNWLTEWCDANKIVWVRARARDMCIFSRGQKRDEKYVSGSFTFVYYFTGEIFYFSAAANKGKKCELFVVAGRPLTTQLKRTDGDSDVDKGKNCQTIFRIRFDLIVFCRLQNVQYLHVEVRAVHCVELAFVRLSRVARGFEVITDNEETKTNTNGTTFQTRLKRTDWGSANLSHFRECWTLEWHSSKTNHENLRCHF